MRSVSCEIAGPLRWLLPQDFNLDMLCACFAQKSLVAYVCVCEHANEEGGEASTALGGSGGGAQDTNTPFVVFLGTEDVALLETSSIWCTLVSPPNVFLAPGVK